MVRGSDGGDAGGGGFSDRFGGGGAFGSGGGREDFAGMPRPMVAQSDREVAAFCCYPCDVRARALFVLALPLTACSLLVNFVDAPDAAPDASFDVVVAPPDAGPDAIADTGVDVYDGSQVCKSRGDGWYCGFNGLNGTPPPNWLVHCVDAASTIRVCDGGCLAFPSGTSDRCDECPGMPNGTYCGSQFATYAADNGAYLITCNQGIAAIQVKCANGCTAGAGTAACK